MCWGCRVWESFPLLPIAHVGQYLVKRNTRRFSFRVIVIAVASLLLSSVRESILRNPGQFYLGDDAG